MPRNKPKKKRAFFPYRDPDDNRPTYPIESLTHNQIRDALAAWCRAWPLGWVGRKRLLEHAAWNISYTRNHNAAAKTSHRKKTLKKLREHGIDVAHIRTCVGSDFAL